MKFLVEVAIFLVVFTAWLYIADKIINGKNKNYANSISMQMDPAPIQLPENIKTEIQGFLWHNEGKAGNIAGVVQFENKSLFSK